MDSRTKSGYSRTISAYSRTKSGSEFLRVMCVLISGCYMHQCWKYLPQSVESCFSTATLVTALDGNHQTAGNTAFHRGGALR